MAEVKRRFHIFREAFSISLHNASTLLCFEMLYRGAGFLFLFPLLGNLLRRLPGLAGEPFLAQENLMQILRHPLAMCLLLLCFLMIGLFVYLELAALILYSEKGWRREQLTLWGLFCASVGRTASLLHPRRIAVFLFLPVMAFSVFAWASGYLRMVHIPEFIMEYMQAVPALFGAWVVAMAFFHLLFFFYLFGLPSLVLQRESFCHSFAESRRLLRGRKLRTAGTFVSSLLLAGGVLTGASAAALLLLGAGVRLWWGPAVGRGQFRLYYLSFARVWQIAAGALLSVFLCAVTVALYHRLRGEERPAPTKGKRPAKERRWRWASVAVTACLLMVFSESELGGQIRQLPKPGTQVVAHRAGAAFAPENTVAALKRAVQDGADMAEIDVQQLKDGTLIVLHDTNFSRVSGARLPVWDAIYEQVKILDAGSFFAPSFAGEPIPTLEEMLAAAKAGGIQLMIELKSTGREKGLVEKTLTAVQKAEMEDECAIASMDLELLEQSKEIAPQIPTVYISVLLLSEQYDLDHVDAYSVETTSLTRGLVVQAHLQGKKVYGWTANSENTIRQVLASRPDGVVTDNPLLARYCLETQGEDLLLEELCDLFFLVRREGKQSCPRP